MPLEIRLDSNFELTTNNNNELLLPPVDVGPIPNSFGNPYICQIRVNVTGIPAAIANKIQKCYPLFESINNPYPLPRLQRFANNPCQLEQPLTSEVNCTLQITIDYLESGSNYEFDPTNPQTVTKSCILTAKPQTMQQPIPSQTIPQPIPSQTTSQVNEYPGWVAIDFGTCNTTVTLFDPKQVTGLILPEEQQESLQNQLSEWLNSTDNQTSEWTKFVNELRHSLEVADDLKVTSNNLLTILREIELILPNRSAEFRAYASQKLNEIYTKVFNVPALSSQNLKPVILDSIRKQPEIVSQSEVTNLEPVKLLMGERAKQNRNNVLSQSNSDYQEIQSRFFHSLKRYLGSNEIFTIYCNNAYQKVAINELIQAAYQHLIDLIEQYRNDPKNNLATGSLNKVIVTYPTVAPPLVRKEIEKSLNNIGITQVQTAYDEAIAVALFYVWQQFGANIKIGIEAFKTRCQTNNSQWWQNVLVLDIGGGTTDIALINLTLEEINVFQPDEDRGLGGKYYKLTPKILGASGHPQLGGELITLRLFRYFKVAIADCVLTAVQNGDLDSNDLQQLIEQDLDEQFKDQENKFISGSLINQFQVEDPRKDEINSDVLNTAEKVIHTRWNNQGKSRYLQPFYTLWDYAEEAKLDLSKNQQNFYLIAEQQITSLLQQTGLNFTVKNANSLQVSISKEQFEKILNSVIDEAIEIGKGLMETRLNETHLPDKKVDWLILSGKTCNFPQVLEQIYQKFSQSTHFIWNPARITFIPEYTKLATSVGACYAEKLRQLIFAPEQSKQGLREGNYQLYTDVKNLFYYLPYSFVLEGQDNTLITIFKVGTKLTQIDPHDEMVKARSDWEGSQLTALVKRLDYQGGTPRYWGTYNGERLAKDLGMTEQEFRTQIQVQFEINQKLDIDVLFCRGKNPHYKINTSLPSLQVNPELLKQQNWRIAVNVIESQTVDSKNRHIIFDSQKQKETFRLFLNDTTWQKNVEGFINNLGEAPQNGKYTFFWLTGIDPQTHQEKWDLIGELSQPSRNSDAPCEYYASLDEDGWIRIHVGSIPYCTSDTYQCLTKEGFVYRQSLQLEPQDIDHKRDPFCGQH